MAQVLVFLTTFDNRKAAEKFGRLVVSEGFAACVNVVPSVTSIYRWKGKVRRGNEVLVVGKTTAKGFKSLKRKINSLHPYDVPELIALKIADGHKPYLDWIGNP